MRYAALLLLAGLYSAPLLMANTSPPPPNPPYTYGPVMQVDEMWNGVSTTVLYDNAAVDFGRVFRPTQVGQQSDWLTIRVSSTSSQFVSGDVVNLTSPVITQGAGNFALDTTGFNTGGVQLGNYTEFSIRFAPQSAGSFSGEVTFSWESDPNLNPGVYTDFRVNVSGNSTTTIDPYVSVHELSPAGKRVFHLQTPTGDRVFGKRKLDAGPIGALSLWITNDAPLGAPSLTLGTPVFSGASGEFTLDLTGFNATLTPGASTELVVGFDPATAGLHQGVLEFSHNDGANTNPFQISLLGEGIAESAQIRVGEQAGLWFDNSSLPPQYTGAHYDENEAPAGGRDFGAVSAGSVATLSPTVANADVGYFAWTGYVPGADLTLGTPVVVGDSDFTVDLTTFTTTVSSATTTSFTINFDPQADGIRTAIIEIPHSDSSEREPFRINVTGVGSGSGSGAASSATSGGGSCTASGENTGLWMFLALLAGVWAGVRFGVRKL